MEKLFLTTCFHGNLGYSSIPESRIKEVIDKCYWPIVSISEELGIPLGFEFPAQTLEYIQEKDKGFIEKIRDLWGRKKIEIVGAGYVQSIFPLIPAQVNIKNLEIGNEVYDRILGSVPKIAFVNEQCFSAGLISLYRQTGYKAIIIDWVNANKYNDFPPSDLYKSAVLKGGEESIALIWNDSITFQKLQRYIYGDLGKEDYLQDILSHHDAEVKRCLMIYGNDMEVFNFRARDPQTLHSGDVRTDEIKKIKDLFSTLSREPRLKFILPEETLETQSEKEITVHTAQYPIITKKQDKYNVCRWAVCGNNNWKSNTLCYRAYHLFKEIEKDQPGLSSDLPWEKLVTFWASDFRTHTEKNKYDKFRKDLDGLIIQTKKARLHAAASRNRKQEENSADHKGLFHIDQDNHIIENDKILLGLNSKKGGTIEVLKFKSVSDAPLIKLLRHGYYDDISYGVDFFSGHTIIFNNQKKMTDLTETKISYRLSPLGCVAEVRGRIGQNGYIKKYLVYGDGTRVDADIEFNFENEICPSVFRTFILTLNPDCFDKGSLYYKTVNGGVRPEQFFVDKDIEQNASVDFNITATHCLGSTDEWMAVGDKNKELIIRTNKAETYTVPLIEFKKVKKNYIFRIYNSVCETDETSHDTIFKGKVKFSFSLMCEMLHLRS